eukprot:CAMPEP_0113711422 /NCGR_PEP_ID=MMETSP0038_2-20120614/30745_1 /TAXON_ID=2898 /ORGANISM="Cryptomonas paramecium" /LENGTH=145 /DNA_ID=CAMNT_0000637671 /DNA_START=36 /DNA_END=469 /DNA_ORIENTATION=- /assembly_acc=CAM_ASM_000170
MKRFFVKSEFTFDEYVQRILFGSLILVAVLGLYTLFLTSLGIKDIVLSCMALILNGLLCSMQFYILFKIFELECDHINQYDVEKALRNLLLPEQIIQIFLAILHAMNSAWLHLVIQLPFASWHAYCVVLQKSPVKAVIGKSEEFS